MFMCLFSLLGVFNPVSSLLEEKVLILKTFLLERKFDLRESLGGRFGGGLKMRGIRGLFIEKTPLLHLISNFDFDFLLGLHLGLNLIRLNLRLDVNF